MILVNHKAIDGDAVFASKLKANLSMDTCTGPNSDGQCWFQPVGGASCASYTMQSMN